MFWLRRTPVETQIVVMVVFLALLQAILLSVFGLGAIANERRNVAERLSLRARNFLRVDLVSRCQNELRDSAEEVFRAAFGSPDRGWSGGGLFVEAYLVRGDGSILTPAGLPLALPPGRALEDERLARTLAAEAAGHYGRGEIVDLSEKLADDLEFARRHPFARDEFGASLALAFAASPLMMGTGKPDLATLREMRWLAVLNRLDGSAPAGEISRLLEAVETAAEAAGEAAGEAAAEEGAGSWRGIVERQEARAARLVLLRARRLRLGGAQGGAQGGAARLLRDESVEPESIFYYRRVGREGDSQVLAVDPDAFHAFLAEVEERARQAAEPGIAPRIVWSGSGAIPAGGVEMPDMPGYVAWAEVDSSVANVRGRGRERFYWWIIAFSISGILAGGLLTARVVRREVKLAKLKSGFVSNVSHELKTPLTSIRMFSEMLRNGKVTEREEINECLDVITSETDRLQRLIQQVLDFGRLQSERRRFRWVKGTLAPAVVRETERFRRAHSLDEESFAVEIAADQPVVVHDPEAFGEVVTNLLTNAWKYTPEEGRRILLTLGPQRGRAVLAVEDNGPGIPARERRKIFEQFYRSRDLLARHVEGTGLGLSIARSIVRAHGGRILVEASRLGGSRFVVVLAAVAGARRARGAATPAATEE